MLNNKQQKKEHIINEIKSLKNKIKALELELEKIQENNVNLFVELLLKNKGINYENYKRKPKNYF